MLKFMKKVPGGLLLVPMLISAVFNTLFPGYLASFGGMTEAFLTTKGISYIVGMACFASATLLDLSSISKVLKKQGTLLLAKMIIVIALSLAFIKVFGLNGVWGVSSIAFIIAICSVNPTLYLALVSDYGEEMDKAAFGLVGMLCVPAFPIFVVSLTQGGGIDWTPIISTLIPIVLGLIVGNLDRDLGKMFSSTLGALMVLMGWSFGAGINIIDALKAGPQGVLIAVVYYLALFPILYLIETKLLKSSGISTLGICSIAGMSASVPSILAFSNPALLPLVPDATAQIAFGVVLTSVLTPVLTKVLVKAKGISKNLAT